ncbi:MAG: RdgB/HAM1 family non-canonical purine NTP pyrophosphatase [bacterium]
MEFVLATENRHKAREIGEIVAPVKVLCLLDLDVEVSLAGVEDGDTYEENAIKKARKVAETVKGKIIVGDDSGIEVAALGGRPGILSARYGGDGLDDAKRYELLLKELEGVEGEGRAALFVCVAAAVYPDGTERYFRGECAGVITGGPRGEGGFGYDPVFFVPESGKTMAEMTPEEKHRVSHRGNAFRKLRDALLDLESRG